jgi:hypothetical protein
LREEPPSRYFEATAVGIRLPELMTFEQWRAMGVRFGRFHSAQAWLIGDWVRAGRRYATRDRSRYQEAMDSTGLARQTLKNYARIAGRFEISRRRPSLSWGHHECVAALPPAEQDGWLDRAQRERWSSSMLRQRLRLACSNPAGSIMRETVGEVRAGRAPKSQTLLLDVEPQRAMRWTTAARLQGVSIEEWIVAIADEAAAAATNGTRSSPVPIPAVA